MKRTMNIMLLIVSIISLISLSAISAFAAEGDNSAILTVEYISQTPDPATPGEYVDVRWRVTNAGGRTDQYVFELIEDYPFSVDEDNKITMNSIVGYQSAENGAVVYFRVRVADTAVESETDNTLRLAYYRADGIGGQTVIEQSIRIQTEQGLVDIPNTRVSPSQVSAGSAFNLSIDVANLATNYISNVKVSVGTGSGNFSPIGSSDQKTISRIAGKTTTTVDFQYFADANVPARVHSLPVTVSFTDSLGRESTVSTTIGIPVGAQSQYLANLERSDVFMAGQKGQIVISISNIGRSDINFVVLNLLESEDYKVIGTETSYLGNLESDDFETGQFDIYVNKDATGSSVPIKAKLVYRDAYDAVHEEYVTLQNKLYTKDQAQEIGLVAGGGNGGIIFVVILVLAGVGFWYWRRSKKKNAKN